MKWQASDSSRVIRLARITLGLIAGLCAAAANAAAADDNSTSAKSTKKSAAGPQPEVLQVDPYAGYARTKLFGLEAHGTKFVYVFDRSASMGEPGGKPLREAKDELLASLK